MSWKTQLSRWLVDSAYPLWATRGFDPVHGGFHESLETDGQPVYEPRRIRVQLRQVYSFARAPALGWTGDAKALVCAGLEYVKAHYRRPDGLFRTLVAPDGASLDDRAFLYDQAFVLLALAESQRVLGAQPALLSEALQLTDALYSHLKRPGQGFSSGAADAVPLLANPHMHLLEAALAWIQISEDPIWRSLADELVDLALTRFLDRQTGAIRERFAADWSQLGPSAGPVVEPGHLFEWAWLLLRWSHSSPGAASRAAERLVEIGETYGVHAGVVITALHEDLTVSDGSARLWPQTERLKAAVSLAKRTPDSPSWSAAASAAAALARFLTTRTPGLWHDWFAADGHFVASRAPASSFYHIVCAIAELSTADAPTSP